MAATVLWLSLVTSQASERLPPALSLFTQYRWCIIRASPCSHPPKTVHMTMKYCLLEKKENSAEEKSLPLPAHETLKAPSTEGLAFSQFAVVCSVLYCWTPRDSTPDMTTLFVQRLRSLALFSKATGKPLRSELCWAFRQLLGGQEWQDARKLYPRRWKIPSAYLSLFPEVSCLTVASLIHYLQVTPTFSGSLESADVVFMWCLHTLLITSGIISLPYLKCAWYIKLSDLCSSLLLPSFLGRCNFCIFFL